MTAMILTQDWSNKWLNEKFFTILSQFETLNNAVRFICTLARSSKYNKPHLLMVEYTNKG